MECDCLLFAIMYCVIAGEEAAIIFSVGFSNDVEFQLSAMLQAESFYAKAGGKEL